MLNSHRPPDTTRQCCLCRIRRCELSLETVWQSLNSQPIDHPRHVAFSEEFRFARMQQPTACVHFAWRTTSLRVGGRAARRSCLPGGGRQAGATVLSCLVWRCELSQSDCRTSAFCVGVRPTQTRHERTCRAVGPTQLTKHDKTVRSVSCLAWRVNWL